MKMGKFFEVNKKWSLAIERKLGYFPYKDNIFSHITYAPLATVADIGGGKKPLLSRAEVNQYQIDYIGIDIDPEELQQAPPDTYDDIHVMNIELANGSTQYDIIICRYTLEHVSDAERAIAGLMAMLKVGGTCYIALPSRYALFGKINKVIPERPKKWLLGQIYPSKKADGFPAFYDRASPREYSAIFEKYSGRVIRLNKDMFSGYFTFFLPLHLCWRLATFIQMITCKDYCERFEMAVVKDREVSFQESKIEGSLS
jgi:SAM-dependent methyltransferase